LIKIQYHKAHEVQLKSVITTQKYRDNEAIAYETLNQLQDQAPNDLMHSKNLTYSCLAGKKGCQLLPIKTKRIERANPE
jgi:hypothetical protein